jgi:hypothetical protein
MEHIAKATPSAAKHIEVVDNMEVDKIVADEKQDGNDAGIKPSEAILRNWTDSEERRVKLKYFHLHHLNDLPQSLMVNN